MRPIARPALLLALALLATPARADNPIVRMATPMGDIDIEVCEEVSTLCTHAAPLTAANFLAYVDGGDYVNSFIHRSVTGFVLQGGSFIANRVTFPILLVPSRGLIDSEFSGFSNVRGTLSVPLTSDPPSSTDPCDTDENSGSSGWFINLGPNNQSLDCGLFTVFAVVTDSAGLVIADAINQRFKINFGYGPSPTTPEYVCAPNQQGQCTTNPVPYLIYTDFTRVPEADAALAGAVAIAALAVLTRGRA